MPTERAPPQKRRRLPFNPPRPRASPSAGPSTTATKPNKTQKNAKKGTTSSSSKPRTSKSSTRRELSQTPSISPSPESSPGNRNREPEPQPEQEPESEEGENSSQARIREDEADYILAEIKHNNGNHDDEGGSDIHSSTPTVPPKLLTRLLAHNFQDPKTKIAKDANGAVAKYVDVFVREALARAAYERGEGRTDGRGGGGIGDGFLEVEDLEKTAPQLVLDF